ncbi:MAG: diacylglycerol kinase family protein [Patescibacteria group bacterium]
MKKAKGKRIKKALIIFNPVSGQAFWRYKAQKRIENYLKLKRIKYTFFITKKGTYDELNQFLNNNYDIIVAAGGDGTIRIVVQWMLKNSIQIPLGIIPLGTTNAYAMGLGVPSTLKRALRFAIKNKALPQDVGLVNNKTYFLIAAGAGFSAKFSKTTTRKLKKVWGTFAYFALAIKHSYDKDYIEGELEIDGVKKPIKTKAIIAFNVRSSLNINPYVPLEVNPGVLDILIADEINMLNVLRLAKRMSDPKERTMKKNRVKLVRAKKIIFKPNKKTLLVVDGDTWIGDELKIEIIPNAINIVCERQLQK